MEISKEIQDLIAKATETSTTTSQVGNKTLSQKIKEGLYESSGKIQSLINNILSKKGIISKEEVNALDEEIRIAKEKTLEADAINAKRNILIIAGVGITAIAAIWFLSRRKSISK